MVSIRTCECGCPAVSGPWCWRCAHERTPAESPLGFIPWGSDDFGPDPFPGQTPDVLATQPGVVPVSHQYPDQHPYPYAPVVW